MIGMILIAALILIRTYSFQSVGNCYILPCLYFKSCLIFFTNCKYKNEELAIYLTEIAIWSNIKISSFRVIPEVLD